ncbi:uncharacterized protein LOC110465758 isoform X2 [Mizuhopecten yessoensis]|nr:uncharacterized protein LOC110465758 isoform X2 [Mizuhopecten yessoensis]XP_021377501.1 uncharacterized protein LOC110465758 isoform X2 [Mizuhopecten yessoensis]
MEAYQFRCSLVEMSVKDFYLHYKDSLPKLIMITQGYCGEVVLDTFDREQILRIHTYSIQKRVIAKMCEGCHLPGVEGTQLSIPINYDAKFCVIKSGAKVGKEETLQDIVNKHNFPVDVQFGKSGGDTIKVGDTDKSTRQTGGQTFRISLLDTHEEYFLLGNAVYGTNLYGKVTVVPVYLPDLRLSLITGFAVQPQERFDAVCRQMQSQVVKNIKFENVKGNEDIAVYSGQATSQDIYSYASPVEYCHIDEGMEKGRKKSRRDDYTDLIPKAQDDNVYDIIPHDTKLEESVYNEPDPKTMVSKTAAKVLPKTKLKPVTISKPPAQIPAATQKKPAQIPAPIPKPPAQIPAPIPKPPAQIPAPPPKLPEQTHSPAQPPQEDRQDESTKGPPPPVPKRGGNSQYSVRKIVADLNDVKIQSKGDGNGHEERVPNLHVERQAAPEQIQARCSVTSDQIKVDKLSVDDLADWMVKLKLEKYTEDFKEKLIDGTILLELDNALLKEEFGMKGFEAIKLMKFAKEGHVPKTRET